MIILQPIPDVRIWGGARLKQYCDSPSDKIGHLYSAVCRPDYANIILNGEFAGKSFYDYFTANKQEYGLSAYGSFPLTIALVEAKENLSIQVHPDHVKAMELEGVSIGKAESWYFIDTAEGAFIYNGTSCGSKEELKTALRERRIEERLVKSSVKAGDYACIKAGTLHAMAQGVFVYEIEYGSDFTYRFYDFERTDDQGSGRELHIDRAMACVDVRLKAEITSYEKHHQTIEETNYTTARLTGARDYRNKSKTLECLTLIDGWMEWDGCRCMAGMSAILEPGEGFSGQDIRHAIVARCTAIES